MGDPTEDTKKFISRAANLLLETRAEREGSQTFQNLQQQAEDFTSQPFTFTPELTNALKTNVAVDSNQAFNDTMAELQAQFEGTSGTRSGGFQASAGGAAAQLATDIARGQRDIDIQAALQRQPDLQFSQNLGSNQLQLQSQLDELIAALYGGNAAAVGAQGPSAFSQAGGGVGGILSALAGNTGLFPG